MVHGEADHRKIELESPLYDALYGLVQHQVGRRSPLFELGVIPARNRCGPL